VIAGDDHCVESRCRTDHPIVLSQLVVQVRGQQYAHLAERYQKNGMELEYVWLRTTRDELIASRQTPQ
jgi:hypothetical protein